jgi:hypothetical protein
VSKESEPDNENSWRKPVVIFKNGVRLDVPQILPNLKNDPCEDFELECSGRDATSGRRWATMTSLLMRGRVR